MLRSFLLACATSACLLSIGPPVSAGALPCSANFSYYPDFGGALPPTLTLVGSALNGGGVAYLTELTPGQAGAIWYNAGRSWINDGFDTTFNFQMSGEADGIAFVIQDEGLAALGSSGSGMGYEGITRSLAVEIDTFCFEDEFACDHISIQSRGAQPNGTSDEYSFGHVRLPIDVNDGAVHALRVVYFPGVLAVFFEGASTPIFAVGVDLNDIMGDSIADPNGCAIVGFTGATGSAVANQTINAWKFNDTASQPPLMCNVQVNLRTISNPLDFELEGSATIEDGSIVLTQGTEGEAGAAWYRLGKATPNSGFSTEFAFRLSGQADGFAFVLQNDSLEALGEGGSGLGYSGINRALVIEFDTFCFADEFECDHVSLQTGYSDSVSSGDFNSISHATLPFVLHDDEEHVVQIVYNVGSLEVYVDGAGLISGLDINNLNIVDEDGCLYMGFTGSTGAAAARQAINSWTFSSGEIGCQPADYDYINLGPETVSAGTSMVLSVGPLGTEPFSYTWFRDGDELEDGGNISGAHTSTLVVNPTTTNDSGQYDILLSNDCGSAATGMYKNVVPACPGDADHDGDVDFADITAVLTGFNFNYLPNTGSGDANGNGVVNFADITSVLTFFGVSCN